MCSISFNVDHSQSFPPEENQGKKGNLRTKSNSLLNLLLVEGFQRSSLCGTYRKEHLVV